MNDRSPLFMLLAALGVGAFMFVQNPLGTGAPHVVQRGSDPDRARVKAEHDNDPNRDRVAILLHEFWGLSTSTWEMVTRKFTDTKSDIVIVSLPDPVDSHFGPTFDQMVEAIQLAASAAGYTLDRFELRWRRQPPPADTVTTITHAGTVGEAALTAKSQRQPPPATHREEPGALLFRRGERALLVLLVGETPTSGVRQGALAKALHLHAALLPSMREQPGRRSVFVLGPWFSGAAYSLRNTIERWVQDRDGAAYDVRFISGCASVEGLVDILGNCDLLPGPQTSYCFRSLSWPRSAIQRLFDEYVGQHGAAAENTVLFTEAGTLYGAVGGPTPGKRNAPGEEVAPLAGAAVSYPLHLAHIRSAFSREGLLSDDLQRAFNSSSRGALSLSLEVKGEPTDVPPVFFPADAAVVGDREVSALLAHLNRERVRFVGILGSDAYDKLFLARRIREYMPNVQLYTILSDLIYVHPDWSRDLVGMWVATPYPLVAETQHGPLRQVPLSLDGPAADSDGASRTPPRMNRRLQFANASMQGVYNAMLAILIEATVPSADEDRTFDLALQMTDLDASNGSPALWITAVGRGEFWPLRRYPASEDLQTAERSFIWRLPNALRDRWGKADPVKAHPVPVGTWSAVLALSCIALGCALMLARAFGSRLPMVEHASRCFPNLRWMLAPPERREASRNDVAVRRVLGMAWFALLAYALGYTVWVIAPGLSALMYTASFIDRFLTIALLAAVLVSSVAVVAMGGAAFVGWARSMAWRRRALRILACLSAGLFLVLIAATLWFAPRDEVALMQFARAAELGSGMSPVTPTLLLCVSGLLVLICKARRIRLLGRLSRVGLIGVDTPFRNLLTQIDRSLGDRQGRRGDLWPIMVGMLIPPGLFVAVVAPRRTWTVDAYPWLPFLGRVPVPLWDVATVLLTLALAGTLMAMTVRFYVTWQRLRRLLRALSATPLVHAFDRLPRHLASAFGLRLSRAPGRLSDLRLSVDQLRLLAAAAPGGGRRVDSSAALVSDPAQIAKTFERELARSMRVPWPAYAYDSTTQGLLARRAARLWAPLEKLWSSGQLPDPASEKHPTPRADIDVLTRTYTRLEGPADARLRLAEEFVATEFTRYFGYVFTHLKNLLSCAMLSSVFLLLAMASYPFQPQQLLMRCVVGGIVVLVAAFIVVLVQLDRDEILSRTADRTPNRVNFDASFMAQLLTFAGLPLVTLLITQFPAFDRFFTGIIQGYRGP